MKPTSPGPRPLGRPAPALRPARRLRPPPSPLGLDELDLAPIQVSPVQLLHCIPQVLLVGKFHNSLAFVVLVRVGVADFSGLPHVILQILNNEEKGSLARRFSLSLICMRQYVCTVCPTQPQLPARSAISRHLLPWIMFKGRKLSAPQSGRSLSGARIIDRQR